MCIYVRMDVYIYIYIYICTYICVCICAVFRRNTEQLHINNHYVSNG
jgi:hypothetical protein